MPYYPEILKTGEKAANEDKKIFELFAKNKISTRECFEMFMRNNVGQIVEEYWNPDEFVKWIKSLGY